MNKRFISFLVIIFALLSRQQVFAYDFEIDGIQYTVISFEESIVRVDGLNQSLSGIIEIPSTIIYNNKVLSVTTIKSCSSNNIETVLIPTSITRIEDGAFAGSSIKTISIPNSVTYLGSYAFSYCENLTSIVIPKTIKTLNSCLFLGCSSLSSFEWRPEVNSPDDEAIIYTGVFWKCESLETFSIPKEVVFRKNNSNYPNVFNQCYSLRTLIIEDGTRPLNLCSTTSSMPEFGNCVIRNVYIGRNFNETIQDVNLKYVEQIVIGDSVTSLFSFFKLGCTNTLKRFVVGASVPGIPDFGYGDGNNVMEYIKIKQETPPYANGFSNYMYINTILYVPKGAKSAYQTADKWKNFWNIQEYSEDETVINKCAKPLISYSEGKLSFSCETDGVSFHSSISDSDIKSYNENEIQLNVTYNINVYASKLGYDNSDVATATLCWVDVEPQSEGLSDGLTQVKANPVLIQTENGNINIKGANDGTDIYIYGINGQLVGSTISKNGNANIRTNLQSGSIVVVKIGSKSVKTIIK